MTEKRCLRCKHWKNGACSKQRPSPDLETYSVFWCRDYEDNLERGKKCRQIVFELERSK